MTRIEWGRALVRIKIQTRRVRTQRKKNPKMVKEMSKKHRMKMTRKMIRRIKVQIAKK